MDRIEGEVAYPAVGKRAEVGQSREDYYTTSKLEPFGLNRRTRRVARGDKAVTTPDGKNYAADGKPVR